MKKSQIKKQYQKTGFTLAEVLITLLIIGVISSIVIPALISETQDAELHTAWKKTYADLDQTTKRIMMDNGGTMKGSFINFDDLKNNYLKYLSYNKKCGGNAGVGNCWHQSGKWFYPNNGGGITNWTWCAGAMLNNGVLILIDGDYPNCNPTSGYPHCGYIFVDVNGFKGPNTIGKDIFGLHILEKGIKPFGSQGDGMETYCNNTYNGWCAGCGCSAKYLYN